MQSTWRNTIVRLLAMQAVCLGLTAQSASHAAKPKAVLVELFTSEGCSSCPPADAILREINGSLTSDNQLIVGISEHVTYWNHLGWSDPFSLQLFTDRQNAYGDRLHLDSVYTPQIIVNGSEQVVGSDRTGLVKAFAKEQKALPSDAELHILSTAIVGKSLQIHLSATSTTQGDIVAVLADDIDQSSVARGENSGRKLSHVAVARTLTRVAPLHTIADQEILLPLPPAFNASQKHHLILFAQTHSYGRVIAIDTVPLTPTKG